MKQYCINDFLGSSYGFASFSRQRNFRDKYVRIEDLTESNTMQAGDEFGKILIYNDNSKDNIEQEISLFAPQNGFYFIDTFYVLNRTRNVDINENIIRCYEEVKEGVLVVADEDFADVYNDLFENLYYYNNGFVQEIELLRKFAYLGERDFSIGFPKTEKPIDFWTLVDLIFAQRKSQNLIKTIQDIKTLTEMVDEACHMSHTMLFIPKKKIIIEENIINFDEIAELSANGDIKDKFKNRIGYTINAPTRIVVSNIIQAHKSGDYSQICNLSEEGECSCWYAIGELINIEKSIWSASNGFQLELINPFDSFRDNKVPFNQESCHYYIEGEPIFELKDSYNKIIVYCRKSGYYSFAVPSFFSTIFLDLPFIHYISSTIYHERLRKTYEKINAYNYTIEQDRFTKAKTLKWMGKDYIQLLPDEWYSFFVSFNYKNDVSTIILGLSDLYTKQKIKNKGYIHGKSYVFYLLLENGQSIKFDRQRYRESYINDSTFDIWVEYAIDLPEIVAFTRNAIIEIRIETPEDNRIEYCTEPFFYEYFKKYAKLYYDAIAKCDPSIKADYSISIPIAETCFVYLMHDTTNGYYKIGISNNPEYRERTLQSEKPTIELIKAKEFPVRAIAEAFEAALHKTYAAKRLRGEWFRLEANDVKNLIKSLS